MSKAFLNKYFSMSLWNCGRRYLGLSDNHPLLKKILKFVLSLNPKYLLPQFHNNIEKYLLRKAFDIEVDNGKKYLPDEILWRTKNAFSDATSIIGKTSWKEYLKQYADKAVTDSRFEARALIYDNNSSQFIQTKEDMLYREIFDEFNYSYDTIKYKWMPNWSDPNLTDASATELPVFKQ